MHGRWLGDGVAAGPARDEALAWLTAIARDADPDAHWASHASARASIVVLARVPLADVALGTDRGGTADDDAVVRLRVPAHGLTLVVARAPQHAVDAFLAFDARLRGLLGALARSAASSRNLDSSAHARCHRLILASAFSSTPTERARRAT